MMSPADCCLMHVHTIAELSGFRSFSLPSLDVAVASPRSLAWLNCFTRVFKSVFGTLNEPCFVNGEICQPCQYASTVSYVCEVLLVLMTEIDAQEDKEVIRENAVDAGEDFTKNIRLLGGTYLKWTQGRGFGVFTGNEIPSLNKVLSVDRPAFGVYAGVVTTHDEVLYENEVYQIAGNVLLSNSLE